MNIIDWILNLAGLFLWIDWRSGRLPARPRSVLSLANAVRPPERRFAAGWGSLALLVLMLAARPWLYTALGSKLEWTPTLDLLAISLPWRSDQFDRMAVYSTLSFVLTLGVFYTVMLLLGALNRKLPETDPVQHFVRLQLGWLDRLPWPVQVLLPSLGAALLWAAVTPVLDAMGALPGTPPAAAVWGQALAFGLAALLAWKWFLVILFLLHLLNLYVYLGPHPVWPYISLTARKLLWPVSFLSFRKLDLAPVAGAILVFALEELALIPVVIAIFQAFAS